MKIGDSIQEAVNRKEFAEFIDDRIQFASGELDKYQIMKQFPEEMHDLIATFKAEHNKDSHVKIEYSSHTTTRNWRLQVVFHHHDLHVKVYFKPDSIGTDHSIYEIEDPITKHARKDVKTGGLMKAVFEAFDANLH